MSIYSHSISMVNPVVLVKMVYASARLVKNPKRLDEVIALADAISTPGVMKPFIDEAAQAPATAAAIARRPRVLIDPAAFRRLPPGTLGRSYIDFMDKNGLRAEDLPHRPSPDEASWVRAHLFETHDIWHVVTGFATDEAGELGLQAFYLAQLPARLAPLLLAIGLLNTMIYRFDDKVARMDAVAAGLHLGRSARPFFATDWNALWALPLGEVRARLGVSRSMERAAA